MPLTLPAIVGARLDKHVRLSCLYVTVHPHVRQVGCCDEALPCFGALYRRCRSLVKLASGPRNDQVRRSLVHGRPADDHTHTRAIAL